MFVIILSDHIPLLSGEDLAALLKLTPEDILLRWFNYHLKKAGSTREVKTWNKDLKDSECYSLLLNQLNPAQCALVTGTDPLERAQQVCVCVCDCQRIWMRMRMRGSELAFLLSVCFLCTLLVCPGFLISFSLYFLFSLLLLGVQQHPSPGRAVFPPPLRYRKRKQKSERRIRGAAFQHLPWYVKGYMNGDTNSD